MDTATLTVLHAQLRAVRAQADAALAVLDVYPKLGAVASDANALPPALRATLDRIRADPSSPGDAP